MAKEMNSFIVMDENGNETKCDVLFTFDSEETGKSYIVYTDNSEDKDGNVQVFASVYHPDSEDMRLLPIESDKEWKIIEIVLDEIQNEVRDSANRED